MKKPRIFLRLDEQEMIRRIAKAKKRIVFAAPSISEDVAHAIGLQTIISSQLKIDVILDVDPASLRLGYGQIGALKYLMDNCIDIRCASGLKVGILAVDHRSFVFVPTARIIEDPESASLNAINIDPTMTKWLLHAMIPRDVIVDMAKSEFSSCGSSNDPDPDQPGEPPESEIEFGDEISEPEPITFGEGTPEITTSEWIEPEIGSRLFRHDELEELVDDIENRPPKQFGHEREILVYSGYLRFVDVKFTGGRLSARTVQLPESILSLAGDRPELVDIRATCKLFEGVGVFTEVALFEKKVEDLRRRFTKSLGNELGRVVLIKDLVAFDKEVQNLNTELDDIRKSSAEKVARALKRRKKRLKRILYPLLFKTPTAELTKMLKITSYPKDEAVGRYLTWELDDVFPEFSTVVGKMDLACIYKDVTWNMLTDGKFRDAILQIFPDEEFTKLYKETITLGPRQPRQPKEVIEDADEWPSEIG